MKERFEGDGGRNNLIAALKEQRLVQHDEAAARALAERGEVVAFRAGDALIRQDGVELELFFILFGTVDVFVNDRQVENHGPREAVGEMAVADRTAPRSATVKAVGDVVAWRVSGEEFERIANQHPVMWRSIAKVISQRLRNREKFHRRPNARPILFLGSSVEGLEVAREIQCHFKHESFDVRVWSTKGVFEPSRVPIEELVRNLAEVDFAALVFGPDDTVASRGREVAAPRDNVIFEMGLFIGRIGHERVFVVKEQRTDLKMPSDLVGVIPLTYIQRSGSTLADQTGPLCHELRDIIRKRGPV